MSCSQSLGKKDKADIDSFYNRKIITMALIDLSRVRQLSEYSHLETQASILYQQNWNDLNGPKVLQDLIDNSGLWQSFK